MELPLRQIFYLFVMTFALGLASCKGEFEDLSKQVKGEKRYEICRADGFGLSSYFTRGECNVVNDSCPSGFSKVAATRKVDTKCELVLCSSPFPDGTIPPCTTEVLQ